MAIHRALSRSLDFHLFRRLASMAALYRAPRRVLALRHVDVERDQQGRLHVRDARPHDQRRHELRRHARPRRARRPT